MPNNNVTIKLPTTLTFERSGRSHTGRVTKFMAELDVEGSRKYRTLELADFQRFQDEDGGASTPAVETPTFTVNERFGFLADYARMVVRGVCSAMLVTGPGGLGKTQAIMSVIRGQQLVADKDYKVLKGCATARGLYDYLYKENGKLIVVDDCDSAFDTEAGTNILKAALDTHGDERTITWMSRENPNSEVPNSFDFTGKIIFISNRDQDDIPQPILTRTLKVNLSMTTAERLARIEYLLPAMSQHEGINIVNGREAYALLVTNLHVVRDLNLRTMSSLLRIRKDNAPNWSSLATFQLAQG